MRPYPYHTLIAVLSLLTALQLSAQVQPLPLSSIYQGMEAQNPLSGQRSLLRQSAQTEQLGLAQSRLPKLYAQAAATLQSEAPALPFDLPVPGGGGLDLPLYRLQATANAEYALYDGGARKAQQKILEASAALSEAALEAELQQPRAEADRYIGQILLLRAQAAQLSASQEQLGARASQLAGAVEAGAALPGEHRRLQAELLRLQAKQDELHGALAAMRAALSSLTGLPIPEGVAFQLPIVSDTLWLGEAKRLELNVFEQQALQAAAQPGLARAALQPKVAAFLQAGIGAPNPVNFFDRTLSPFAIGGLQLNWPITDWGQASRADELARIKAEQARNRAAAFLTTNQRQAAVLQKQIETFGQLAEQQEPIIELETASLEELGARLQQGTALAADYIEQATRVRTARLLQQQYQVQQQTLYLQLLTLKGIQP